MQRLPAQDRELFELVSRAAFVNPFGDERDALDIRIAQTEGDDPDLLNRLVRRIEGRLSALEEKGDLTPDAFPHDDWRLLEHAILFEAFHRFAERLDALIEEQLAAGEEPVEIDIAAAVLSRLTSRGLDRAHACRMLAFIWQLRRAYYFIASGLTGVSPSMRRLREAIWNDVFTHDLERYERTLHDRLEDFSVILRGETGTGKGAAAAAIGRSGFVPFDEDRGRFASSFTELFVPINLSQFPESLIESELFGHKKGAFTGAVDTHAGVFSRCSENGAIFLDEIGEVSVPVQIKLLRVLQERVFSPVGGPDAEVVEMVRASIGRDLPDGYAWPGNVRELEQVVRRVLLTGRCAPAAAPRRGDDFLDAVQGGQLTAKALTERYCALLHGRLGTYEEVARVTGLDRRTVRKYVVAAGES